MGNDEYDPLGGSNTSFSNCKIRLLILYPIKLYDLSQPEKNQRFYKIKAKTKECHQFLVEEEGNALRGLNVPCNNNTGDDNYKHACINYLIRLIFRLDRKHKTSRTRAIRNSPFPYCDKRAP